MRVLGRVLNSSERNRNRLAAGYRATCKEMSLQRNMKLKYMSCFASDFLCREI